MLLANALSVFAFLGSTLAMPNAAPVVNLDYGAFQGFTSASSTESFLGVPFAQPPVGQLRFNNPIAPLSFSGVRNATGFGNACSQQPVLGPNGTFPTNPGLNGLYLNVVRPAGVAKSANLPVVAWIYGDAFESGDASAYNGTQIVSRSVSLKSPVVYVSFNYRMNAFGFLGGKEVRAAGLGNFGLHDQRFALQWVQKYTSLFGGDPDQVIVWGQSSNSISMMLQMVAYDGQLGGLFKGAVMESGAASPIYPITLQHEQDNYDFLVEQANCTSANDTSNCLRQAPYQTLLDAVLQTTPLLSYQALNISWRPQVDGIFLKQTVRQSLSQGKYAQVPAILGDVDDEGTLFSLYNLNVITNDQFLDFLVGATQDEINQVGQLYPEDPALNSPEYMRISSFQGHFYFQVPRRFALSYLSQTQDVWSYLWKRDKFVPGIGSFHESDLQEYYDLTGSTDWVGTDALVNFAYRLNPNNGCPAGAAPSLLSNISWPQYKLSSPQLLTFEDTSVLAFTNDTFRVQAMQFLDQLQTQMGL